MFTSGLTQHPWHCILLKNKRKQKLHTNKTGQGDSFPFTVTLTQMCFILLNGSDGIESACSAGDLDLIPGLGRNPQRREWLSTPAFWPGESHGLYSPWGCTESNMIERQSLHKTKKDLKKKKRIQIQKMSLSLVFVRIPVTFGTSV